MQKHIEQALVNLNSLNPEKGGRIKKVLRRYVDREIGLNEVNYELRDTDLIPMPPRCEMFGKANNTPEEEEKYRNYLKNKLIYQEI